MNQFEGLKEMKESFETKFKASTEMIRSLGTIIDSHPELQ